MYARMPWGKYKGQLLVEIPTSYLCWLLEEGVNMSAVLRREIHGELARRLEIEPVLVARDVRADPEIDLEGVIATWFRRLALRWHPDRGHGGEGMQALNDAHDEIRELLRLRR